MVAAVLTGAVFGGLAVAFSDLAECLGCLLGGFCLSMWLLTLHPGGLVTPTNGKLVFIAVFTFAAFGLYFSRWTRTYGLISCISFSGSTAVVLGIDCFSRAGLKEFWAYIWNLNDKLFPDGAVNYPLTRGIRVELAVTVLMFIIGIISQLKLWRLIKDRRKKGNGDEPAEGDPEAIDDEENIGRQVEERTNRERQEWERMYGDAAPTSSGDLLLDTELPTPTSEKIFAEGTIVQKDFAEEKMTVRVVEDTTGEEDMDDSGVDGVHEEKGPSEELPASPKHRSHKSEFEQPESPVLPTFKRPATRAEIISRVRVKSKEEDRVSVAAFVNDEEEYDQGEVPNVPSDMTRDSRNERRIQRMSSSSTAFRWSYSQHSTANQRGNRDSGGRSRRTFSPSIKSTKDEDNDSIVATLDEIGSIADAEIRDMGWLPRVLGAEGRASLESRGSLEVAGTVKPKRSFPEPWDDSGEELTAQVVEMAKPTVMTLLAVGESHQSTPPRLRSSGAAEPVIEARTPIRHSKSEGLLVVSKDVVPLKDAEEPSLKGSESAVSFQTALARLTEVNLPPALPQVALTYRMSEWAKHLNAAETPEPDALKVHEDPEAVSDTPNEEPAPLDILELQLTAENATPPPAVPRTASAMSTYASLHTRSGSKSSAFSYSELAGLASRSESPSGHKAHRSVSMMLKGLFPAPIAEEGDSDKYNQAVQSVGSAANVQSSLPTSTSTSNLSMQGSPPGVGPYPPKPQTLIGMREMLLKTRASGIFARLAGDAVHIPTEPGSVASQHRARPPSDASSYGGFPTHPSPAHLAHRHHPSHSSSVDLDDLPLSQRRAMIMRRSNSRLSNPVVDHHLPNPTIPTAPTLTAESVVFDSHQPSRRSSVPSEAVHQARLANFRSSVAADLRSVTPSPAPGQFQTHVPNPHGSTISLRSMSPLPHVGGGGNFLGTSPSMLSLHAAVIAASNSAAATAAVGTGVGGAGSGGGYHQHQQLKHHQQETKGDVLRTIDLQRSILLGQKEAEAQRKEAEWLEKQQYQREFEERMRSGELMGAHRDAMRRMQGGVKVG